MPRKTTEQISYNMSQVKNKDSKIEITLRKALWRNGLRYRINQKGIFGNPDVIFSKRRVAIFCDSEFFHGYDWENAKEKIKTNREFWIPKIERNIERDRVVNNKLQEDGWIVLRFWGNDLLRHTSQCVEIVMKALMKG